MPQRTQMNRLNWITNDCDGRALRLRFCHCKIHNSLVTTFDCFMVSKRIDVEAAERDRTHTHHTYDAKKLWISKRFINRRSHDAASHSESVFLINGAYGEKKRIVHVSWDGPLRNRSNWHFRRFTMHIRINLTLGESINASESLWMPTMRTTECQGTHQFQLNCEHEFRQRTTESLRPRQQRKITWLVHDRVTPEITF